MIENNEHEEFLEQWKKLYNLKSTLVRIPVEEVPKYEAMCIPTKPKWRVLWHDLNLPVNAGA